MAIGLLGSVGKRMRIVLKGSVQFLAVNNSDRYNSASLYLRFL